NRLLRFVAQMFQEVLLEKAVDKAALLGEDALDDPPGQVAEHDSVAADAQAMVAGKPFPQGQAVAPLGFESPQGEPDPSARFRRKGFDESLKLLPSLDPVSHSPSSSRVWVRPRPASASAIAFLAAGLARSSVVSIKAARSSAPMT